MKKVSYTHSRSGIFLMEIIIAILFFSIVSAICLNIFVHTHNLSKSTAELNFAVREAANPPIPLKTQRNALRRQAGIPVQIIIQIATFWMLSDMLI